MRLETCITCGDEYYGGGSCRSCARSALYVKEENERLRKELADLKCLSRDFIRAYDSLREIIDVGEESGYPTLAITTDANMFSCVNDSDDARLRLHAATR